MASAEKTQANTFRTIDGIDNRFDFVPCHVFQCCNCISGLCCAGSAGPRRDGEGTRAPVETERRSGMDDGQFLHAVVPTSNRII